MTRVTQTPTEEGLKPSQMWDLCVSKVLYCPHPLEGEEGCERRYAEALELAAAALRAVARCKPTKSEAA
jgi:hypothetical protein